MKFAICLALCMQLCAQLFADPIPAHQGLPQCTDSALTVTVDNQIIELYLDGTQVTGLKNKDTWGAVDTVHVPAATKVIAIKGFDYGQIAGILASGTFYKTDASWKCTNVYSDGWAAASFDDSAWPAATEIDVNGASPWGPIAGISNDAKWIWTAKFTYGPDSDRTVYCRKKPDCTVEQSTGPAAIKSCVDKADGDYQSNKGCHVYATCSNGYLYDNRPCAPSGLFWDDNAKRCEWSSPTCTEFV